MNKKIIRGFLMFALAVFSMSSFVACKDYDDSAYDDVKARLNQEITLREALQQQVDALEAYVKTLKSCECNLQEALKDYLTKDEAAKTYVTIDNYNTAIALLNQAITEINNTLGDVDLSKGTVAQQLNTLNQLIINVQTLGEKALELAEANKADIEALKKAIEDLQAKYIELDERLTALEKKTAELYTLYNTLNTQINFNSEDIKNIYNIIENLVIEYPDLKDYVTHSELETVRQELMNLITKAQNLAQDAWDLAKDNEQRISDLEDAIKNFVTKKEFNDKISEIEGRLTDIETKLGTLETTVNNLKSDLLKKMITGIVIQGTESPVIGYFNTPFDVRSQILAAYYGETTKAVKFPVKINTEDLVDASMAFTSRNMEVMGGFSQITIPAGRFVSQVDGAEDGNAGTLYLTINPNTVNFAGVTLDMETSKGAVSPIKLSPLAYSDRELTFGYTRSADNGFYEAKATLTEGDIDAAKMKIDYTTLENEAKDVIKNKDKASVLTFGAALMNSVKDVMPAYGVKASWTDATEGTTHNVFSEYGLATTAIKPLSYEFLKGFKANLPGEGKLQDLLDRIIDKIKIQINLNLPDFSKYQGSITFKDITLPTISDEMLHITYKLNLQNNFTDGDGNPVYIVITNSQGEFGFKGLDGKIYIIDEYGNFVPAPAGYERRFDVFTEDLTIDIDINKTEDVKAILQQIIDSLNAEYGANSDLAKTITDLLNDVAKLSNLNDQINDAIVDAKNDIKSELSKLITRAYNKLNSFFSKLPNAALQPVLVAKSGDNVRLLSRSKSMPTKASGSLTLYPTSYSLELLAPAYKKFVAVTDVWNADGTPAAASVGQAANGENMLKVIDSEKSCTLNGQSGYIYQISYSAVDYHGKVTTKRFYVQF